MSTNFARVNSLRLNLLRIMLKNGQTYVKNLAVYFYSPWKLWFYDNFRGIEVHLKIFKNMLGHFSTLYIKGLTEKKNSWIGFFDQITNSLKESLSACFHPHLRVVFSQTFTEWIVTKVLRIIRAMLNLILRLLPNFASEIIRILAN